jgi:hypothetical protein
MILSGSTTNRIGDGEMSSSNDTGSGRPPAPKRRGSLTQKDFERWEDEHRKKVGREGAEEQQEAERVKKCISLAVKGAICLIIGIAGISAWPFLFTSNRYDSFRTVFVIPFLIVAVIGLVIVIAAGIRFFSSKGGGAGK